MVSRPAHGVAGKTNVKQALIYTVQEKRSPYGGESRGFALMFATPNMAGQQFGKPCPLFAAPYLVERQELSSSADAPRYVERYRAQGVEVRAA